MSVSGKKSSSFDLHRRYFDANKDGKVTEKEAVDGLRKLGVAPEKANAMTKSVVDVFEPAETKFGLFVRPGMNAAKIIRQQDFIGVNPDPQCKERDLPAEKAQECMQMDGVLGQDELNAQRVTAYPNAHDQGNTNAFRRTLTAFGNKVPEADGQSVDEKRAELKEVQDLVMVGATTPGALKESDVQNVINGSLFFKKAGEAVPSEE